MSMKDVERECVAIRMVGGAVAEGLCAPEAQARVDV